MHASHSPPLAPPRTENKKKKKGRRGEMKTPPAKRNEKGEKKHPSARPLPLKVSGGEKGGSSRE